MTAARMLRYRLLLVAILAAAMARGADESKVIFPAGAGSVTSPPTASAAGGNATTVVAALLLAAAAGWLLWRKRAAAVPAGGGRALGIEETRSLGNRQYLVVASYRGRRFLLGVCPGRIDMLTALDGGAEDKR